ncbi:MAG: bestrophin family ion channel [Myxococcota bacterium]|nr:bestrophin family ion channel [Myxococcota bacterium]
MKSYSLNHQVQFDKDALRMIEYDRSAWFTHIGSWKGSVLPAILPRILVVTTIAVVVAVWDHFSPIAPLDKAPHGLVGVALGLLLVFRTNSAYDRFWEGRKRWGMIVNRTRDLSRQSLAWIRESPEEKIRIVHQLILFAYATKEHLRGTRDLSPLADLLSGEELAAIQAVDHMPLQAAENVTTEIVKTYRQGHLDLVASQFLDTDITNLIDQLGACERILKTPIPFAYVLHLRRFVLLFLSTLPLVFVHMDWLMVPVVAIVTYALLGIEEIGVQIEDPFGLEDNDLPLDAICDTIRTNLLELLSRNVPTGRTDTP